MTAISPLESTHKKGLFGDHQKRDETELLRISEIKNLAIVQLVQYKKSKIELKSIKIDNLDLSHEGSTVVSNKDTRILWSSPKTWLIISYKQNIFDEISKNCTEDDFAVTEISHSRTVIKIKGTKAREVLKKGCPLNINEIKKPPANNDILICHKGNIHEKIVEDEVPPLSGIDLSDDEQL